MLGYKRSSLLASMTEKKNVDFRGWLGYFEDEESRKLKLRA